MFHGRDGAVLVAALSGEANGTGLPARLEQDYGRVELELRRAHDQGAGRVSGNVVHAAWLRQEWVVVW